MAAGKGHKDIVRYLVDKTPDNVNSQDNDGVSIIDGTQSVQGNGTLATFPRELEGGMAMVQVVQAAKYRQ